MMNKNEIIKEKGFKLIVETLEDTMGKPVDEEDLIEYLVLSERLDWIYDDLEGWGRHAIVEDYQKEMI